MPLSCQHIKQHWWTIAGGKMLKTINSLVYEHTALFKQLLMQWQTASHKRYKDKTMKKWLKIKEEETQKSKIYIHNNWKILKCTLSFILNSRIEIQGNIYTMREVVISMNKFTALKINYLSSFFSVYQTST